MSITVHAVVASELDFAAIRANGYEAVITADNCGAIARLVAGVDGVTSYPARDEEEEAFYGSYVPSLSICLLPEDVQAQIRAILAGNEDALTIVDQVIAHCIRATCTRKCGDGQYPVRTVSEAADLVDLRLSAGNWKRFRLAIGVNGDDTASEIDAGELSVAELEKALDDSFAALIFSGAWHQQLVANLRSLIAYAKAKGATQLAWA